MAYPKGIKTPEVRTAWLAERREKIRQFDQLVQDGMPRYKAAQLVGRHVSTVEAMRRSIEHMEDDPLLGRARSGQVDLGLSLLACLLKPGETLTAHDIAAWCGCSRSAIQRIEDRALRKMKRRLVDAARDPELARELGELFKWGT